MWFRREKTKAGLTEELTQRVWDCTSRLKQLEDRFDGQLDELSKRYRRAEQSQARLERKQATPSADDPDGGTHGGGAASKALDALRSRKGTNRISSEV